MCRCSLQGMVWARPPAAAISNLALWQDHRLRTFDWQGPHRLIPYREAISPSPRPVLERGRTMLVSFASVRRSACRGKCWGAGYNLPSEVATLLTLYRTLYQTGETWAMKVPLSSWSIAVTRLVASCKRRWLHRRVACRKQAHWWPSKSNYSQRAVLRSPRWRVLLRNRQTLFQWCRTIHHYRRPGQI